MEKLKNRLYQEIYEYYREHFPQDYITKFGNLFTTFYDFIVSVPNDFIIIIFLEPPRSNTRELLPRIYISTGYCHDRVRRMDGHVQIHGENAFE